MHPEIYEQYAAIEESHWWFRSRLELVRALLSRLGRGESTRGTGLEVGCGTGGNLPMLREFCEDVVGVDVSDTALELARRKWSGFRIAKGDANALTSVFPDERFSLITVFNVLCHEWVDSEAEVLGRIFELLEPGGLLVVTEPAFRFLFRDHDVQVMGKRRYRLDEFRSMLTERGFEVPVATYFNAVSFVPAALLALLARLERALGREPERSGPVREMAEPNAALNRLMQWAMALERGWIRLAGSVPLGVSLLCIARKPARARARAEVRETRAREHGGAAAR